MLGSYVPDTAKLCNCSLCEDEATRSWALAFKNGDTEPSDNDLLLAPRVFGYALGKKAFCQFALDSISPVAPSRPEDERYGKEVILPKNVQEEEFEDIKTMVRNHVDAMSKPQDQRMSDSIAGKGESLILLFHGKLSF